MKEWSEGYTTDMPYEMHYFRDLSPAYLRMALLLHGLDMPHRKKNEPLRYLELGYGQGVSLNVHSAAVAGDFWGTDFNPDHALRASETAQAAGLENHVLNHSFAELASLAARGELPQFDVIALHGVWSWISDEARGHILSIINGNLKMGGAVYISYNALPGWAPFMPVRDIMAMHATSVGSNAQNSAVRMQAAYAFVRQLREAGAGYFAVNASAAQRLDSLEGMSLNYVVHEYLNRHWRPFYFTDVAAAMEMVKCSFVTSSRLLTQLDVSLTPALRQMLREAPNRIMCETLRDYALNQQFRADVFVKGSRPLTQREHMDRMGKLRVALACQLEAVNLTINGPAGEIQFKEDVYKPLLAALADKDYTPKTLEELEDHPLLQSMDSAVLTEAVTVLLGAGYAHPAGKPHAAQRDACARLNRVLCERAKAGEAVQVLASPVLGGGVPASRLELLFLLSLADVGEDSAHCALWAQDAWDIMAGRGEQLLRDGQPLEYDEALREMTGLAETFAAQRLPWLRAMGALPAGADTSHKGTN